MIQSAGTFNIVRCNFLITQLTTRRCISSENFQRNGGESPYAASRELRRIGEADRRVESRRTRQDVRNNLERGLSVPFPGDTVRRVIRLKSARRAAAASLRAAS